MTTALQESAESALLKRWNAEAERLARWLHDNAHNARGDVPWEDESIWHRGRDMDAARTFLGPPNEWQARLMEATHD